MDETPHHRPSLVLRVELPPEHLARLGVTGSGDDLPADLAGEPHEWKRLLKLAGVRDGRLHDARHTAATVLLVLGVSGRAVMGIMSWSNSAMAVRYQHMTDQVRRDIAQQLGGLLWGDPPRRPGESGDGPAAERPEQGK